MLVDPNAAVAILSYYLEAKVGNPCSVYCPLGYEPYKLLGLAMAEKHVAFESAMAAGLLSEGIQHYFESALSNADCWWGMIGGILYILQSHVLHPFVPFRLKYMASGLLKYHASSETSPFSWDDAHALLKNNLGDEMRGY